jgi:hypothetical protein
MPVIFVIEARPGRVVLASKHRLRAVGKPPLTIREVEAGRPSDHGILGAGRPVPRHSDLHETDYRRCAAIRHRLGQLLQARLCPGRLHQLPSWKRPDIRHRQDQREAAEAYVFIAPDHAASAANSRRGCCGQSTCLVASPLKAAPDTTASLPKSNKLANSSFWSSRRWRMSPQCHDPCRFNST